MLAYHPNNVNNDIATTVGTKMLATCKSIHITSMNEQPHEFSENYIYSRPQNKVLGKNE